MYCTQCGQEVGEGQKFCPNCGGSLDKEVSSDTWSGENTTTNNSEDRQISSGKRVGYWIARIVQFLIAGFAILLLLGGIASNVLVFLVVAVFALVLFAIIMVIEFLVIRPLGS